MSLQLLKMLLKKVENVLQFSNKSLNFVSYQKPIYYNGYKSCHVAGLVYSILIVGVTDEAIFDSYSNQDILFIEQVYHVDYLIIHQLDSNVDYVGILTEVFNYGFIMIIKSLYW